MTATLASSADEVLKNIEHFSRLAHDIDGQRLSSARAWYATKVNGEWKFGPSKFIGYSGLDADSYQRRGMKKEDFPLDGRTTEGLLQQWFTEVEEGTELAEELRRKLNEFLAGFGKKPSIAARISVSKDYLRGDASAGDDELVKALAVIYRRLSAADRQQFKQLIS
ncbi:hypothetical protein [Microvirga calopogonii]|uniref:hypothetical protein n=1 Tax=Microvirga calopogonii TaxID=2078013 RepID=UPI000E0D2BA6|nr:hypothetical protein [Microvirga calopogonii]